MPVFFSYRFSDSHHYGVGEERQQEIQVIDMMRANRPAGDEARGEFPERHIRIGLYDPEAPVIQFFLVFAVDLFGPLEIGSPCGSLMADAIHPDVGPIHAASLKQAHLVANPPLRCCVSIQRTI